MGSTELGKSIKPPDASVDGGRLASPTVAIIAFTRAGCTLAKRLAEGLGSYVESPFRGAAVSVCGPARYAEELGIESYASLAAWTSDAFARADALAYVGACGIAVRAIAPHVRDKFHDPAVVAIDEAGRVSVPLLSGHVGGANELARELAHLAGGQAVVSTATDVNGLFAVDEWAARRGFAIVERAIAKEISARLLEGGTVGFATDLDVEWDPREGIVHVPFAETRRSASDRAEGGAAAIPEPLDLGFVVSLDDACQPFEHTLHLVPRFVVVGAGCRRDTDPSVFRRMVDEALAEAHVSKRAVVELASIDVKAEERAMLELAQARGWRTRFYSADELAAVPGDFTGSEFVKRTVGVDNVCERAALAEGGVLIARKRAGEGVTVALAVRGVRETEEVKGDVAEKGSFVAERSEISSKKSNNAQ